MRVLAWLGVLTVSLTTSLAMAHDPAVPLTLSIDARSASPERPLSVTIAAHAGKTALYQPEGSHCIGYRNAEPAARINYRAGATTALEVSATSDGDVMLFIEGPDGYIRCSDDTSNTLDPVVFYATPIDGTYSVWVGLPSTDKPRDATVTVTTVARDGETRSAQQLFEAGNALYKRGTVPDLLESVKLLRLAVNRNHKAAEDALIGAAEFLTTTGVLMVDNGTGSLEDAYKMFLASNDTAVLSLQVTSARISLANVAKRLGDNASSARWYWLVAYKDVPEAQFRLGLAYETGEGVAMNIDSAAYWYRRGANQGNWFAQFAMGYLSLFGEGVAQSDTEAARWFTLASDQGYAEAQYQLGILYETGRGVAKNLKEAARLFESAAALGQSKAAEALARVRAGGG